MTLFGEVTICEPQNYSVPGLWMAVGWTIELQIDF